MKNQNQKKKMMMMKIKLLLIITLWLPITQVHSAASQLLTLPNEHHLYLEPLSTLQKEEPGCEKEVCEIFVPYMADFGYYATTCPDTTLCAYKKNSGKKEFVAFIVYALQLAAPNKAVKILSLATVPVYRGMGVAKQLINHVETIIKPDYIFLTSLPEAIDFYQKVGFKNFENFEEAQPFVRPDLDIHNAEDFERSRGIYTHLKKLFFYKKSNPIT